MSKSYNTYKSSTSHGAKFTLHTFTDFQMKLGFADEQMQTAGKGEEYDCIIFVFS